MGSGVEQVHNKIKTFKRKYYLNIFLRGLILSLTILTGYILLAAVVEHNLWLQPLARLTIFIVFFIVAGFCIFQFMREPIQWWLINRGLSEEQTAQLIGQSMPGVSDRLLNFLQLLNFQHANALVFASVNQKSKEFEPLSFESIIDLKQNVRYIKFLAIPLLLLLVILIFNKSILTQSTFRLVNFNTEFTPKAPFDFLIQNETLTAFYNEDFTLKLNLKGSAVPQDVYLLNKNNRYKLERTASGFEYRFEKLQEEVAFELEAAGFYSDRYKLTLNNRPELLQFKIELEYPRYLQKKNEQVVNTGNLEVPEGTRARWKLATAYAEKAHIKFAADSLQNELQQVDNQTFTFQKVLAASDHYSLTLANKFSNNKDKISYSVDVVKDQYPTIVVNNLKDSVLYKRVMLGGFVGDDYGVTQLALHYQIRNANQEVISKKSIQIPIARNQLQQSFYYNWSLDSLQLKPDTHLEYHLQAWDNDGVNGRKSTRTGLYSFHIPSEENLVADIKRSQNQTEQKIDQSVGKADKLHEQIEQANQKLKGKQSLNWQDKKMLEDIIQQKQSLDKMLEQIKEQNKLLEQKKESFTEQDERIREKAEQIQKLMEELLDEETKKLFEELQRLLKENADVNQIQKLMNKMEQNTNSLEKELERTLQLYKELQYEYKIDQAAKNLAKQIEDQKAILEKTDRLEKNKGKDSKSNKLDQKQNNADDGSKKDAEELAKEQEELMQRVDQNKSELNELNKLSEELHKNEDLPSEEDSEELLGDQEESKEMLEKNEPGKAKSPQQKSLKKMEKMQQQMQKAQSGMGMEMEMENLESLRQIIHGLVKLSYDQESLMKQFGELQQNDPRFNVIAQQQLKLKDDALILEDSLLALGKRDPFMGSIVTKEVTALKSHLDNVIDANKERRRPQAASEMQGSMTSINNLALMLDNHFEMMMQMMANAQPSMKKSKQKGQKPSLSEMQQQLNSKIQELKNGGKSGRQLSEELAEMAAEQERIRKALQEMQKNMKDGKMPGGDMPGKMEQTEMELVNKQLTDQLIKRQQEILTRLLETEKSMREQDLDEERKGEAAKEYDKEIPKAFEEYLRLKEKEVELLKTVPPKLYPFYKKEVNEYFKRMSNP